MKDRIYSLDVFRGITILIMILVNNPGNWGSIYSPLKHADWNGLTIADLVFPFFLFILGVSIPFSSHDLKKIIIKSIYIFLLGFLLNLIPKFNFETVRIPGVLQRISIVLLFCSLIYYCLKKYSKTEISSLIILSCLFIFLNLFHSIVLLNVPIPGLDKAELVKDKNISGFIDLYFLKGHLWEYSKTWDPEGIFGTITSISTSLAGMIIGIRLKSQKKLPDFEKIFFILISILSLMVSILLLKLLPYNKSLWTSSFVLICVGIAIFTFIILHYIIDENKNYSFFMVFEKLGQNSLFLFFFTSLISKLMNIPFIVVSEKKIGLKTFLYNNYFQTNFSKFDASFFWSVSILLFWILIILVRVKFEKKKNYI